ncbi:MAG: tetratricopeptide repeat protein [Pseudomonadota bacterium]
MKQRVFMRRRRKGLLAAVAAAALAAACASPEQKLERYTNSGLQFLEAEDYGKANIQFRNALKIDEEHVPALLGLYRVIERQNDPQQMFGILSEIARLDGNNVESRIDLAKLQLLASEETAALDRVEEALALAPQNAEAIGVKAAILFRLGDRAEAVRLAEESLEIDAGIQESATVVAADLILDEKYEEAIAAIDKTLAANPDASVLHLLRIEIYSNLEQDDDVDASFRALIEQFPEEAAYRRLYVTTLYRTERFDDARRQLVEIVKLSPDDVDGYLDVARLDQKTGGTEKARATLAAYVSERPDFVDLKFSYAAFLRGLDDNEAAAAIYEELADGAEDERTELRAKNEIAAMLLVDGEREKAEAIVNEILEKDSRNTEAMMKVASLKLLDGDPEGAVNDLRIVIADAEDPSGAQLLMATAFERLGESASAESQFTEAFDATDQKARVGREFAKFLIRQADFEKAQRVLVEALDAQPRDQENLKLLAGVRLQLRDWRGAQETAKLIGEAEENDEIVNRILGAAYTGLEDYAGAIEVLEKIDAGGALGGRPLAALVNAYVEDGRAEDAEKLLKGNIENDSNPYAAALLLSQVYLSQSRAEEAKEALRDAIDIDAVRPQAYERLYRIYLTEGRRDDAQTVIEQGLAATPGNDGLKVLRADLHLAAREFEQALSIYEDILSRRPDDILVSNNYAALLSDLRDDQESLDRAVKVASVLSETENASFLDTYGWALVRAGRLAEGIDVLDRAVGLAPNFPDALYHLGEAQLMADDPVGRETLQRAIDAAGEARPDIADKARARLEE